MRIGDRVLLIAAMLLCVAACGYLFAILWGMIPLQGLVQSLYDISDAWYYRIGVSALLLLFMAGFVKLMFLRAGSSQFLLHEGIAINQAGDVRISVDALRQMCEQVAKSDSRIELLNCTVQSTHEGLVIGIKAHSKSEQFLPLIGESIQHNILQTLKDTCGITNARVQVVVEKADIATSAKPGPVVQTVQPQTVDAVKTEAETVVTGGGQENG